MFCDRSEGREQRPYSETNEAKCPNPDRCAIRVKSRHRDLDGGSIPMGIHQRREVIQAVAVVHLATKAEQKGEDGGPNEGQP